MDDMVGHRIISYLPMAHIAERMMSHYAAIYRCFEVTCCPDPTQIAAFAREVQAQRHVRCTPRVGEGLRRRQRRPGGRSRQAAEGGRGHRRGRSDHARR